MENYEDFSWEEIKAMHRESRLPWPPKSSIILHSVSVRDTSGNLLYSYKKPARAPRKAIPADRPQYPEHLTTQLRYAIVRNKIKTFAHQK